MNGDVEAHEPQMQVGANKSRAKLKGERLFRDRTLDYLCEETEKTLVSSSEYQRVVIRELIRRAKEMYQPLAPKPQSEDEKMPEPVEVWLWRPTAHKDMWRSRNNDPSTDAEFNDVDITSEGPYPIFPGMMSLDELWIQHAICIGVCHGNKWNVSLTGRWIPEDYPNAIEAQWAATKLAKKGDA